MCLGRTNSCKITVRTHVLFNVTCKVGVDFIGVVQRSPIGRDKGLRDPNKT